ncbi:MAG: tRNA-guanine transglycosylase [Patescibacteria group bacterium]|nr:MAG: tRNA-guanine transglycosylase [Patescibacteria group bacterium]
MDSIKIRGKNVYLPIFFPDATRGVVRSLDALDILNCGLDGVLVNTYHLYKYPGDDYIANIGGISKFMNFKGLFVSDSGGFQIMSLIYKTGKGKITKEGVKFDKMLLTPEKSIEIQFNLGTDIIIALDYFTDPKANLDEIETSVKITTEWAKRCKDEYEKQIECRKLKKGGRPLLLAVIQGGRSKKMREKSANDLLKIGFDGYGFGGWVIDEHGKLDYEISKFNAKLTPDSKIRFALGVGKPEDIVKCFGFGYHMFDCVLPTRDARHKRLYVYRTSDLDEILSSDNFYKFYYLQRAKYLDQEFFFKKIDKFCDCLTCTNYTLPYLTYLFKINETLAFRLATIHNLRFYTKLISYLRSLNISH